MTVEELIECLEVCQGDANVYVVSPDNTEDYFLDRVRIESDSHSEGTAIFLDTSH